MVPLDGVGPDGWIEFDVKKDSEAPSRLVGKRAGLGRDFFMGGSGQDPEGKPVSCGAGGPPSHSGHRNDEAARAPASGQEGSLGFHMQSPSS